MTGTPMRTYAPTDAFVAGLEKELVATLPFLIRTGVRLVPIAARRGAMRIALIQVIPLTLSSIAMTQRAGESIALTRAGDLAAEVKANFLKRIALWLIADEVSEITFLIQREMVRLGEAGLRNDSWALIIENDEVILLPLDTSLLRETSDTVADVFLSSQESLMRFRDTIASYWTDEKQKQKHP